MDIFLVNLREILYIYMMQKVNRSRLTSFEFPRQKSLRRLCIADFFAPKESGQY